MQRFTPEPGLRLIILYKLVKASFALAISVILWSLVAAGSAERVLGFAVDLRSHLTAAWSIRLADAFVTAADRRHLEVITAALTLDGAATLFEWYALRTGRPWGAWLVVLATSSLLPLEIIAIVRHRHTGRIVLFFVNLVIVVYLVQRTLKKHGRPFGAPPTGRTPATS
jgi:uncharacterized membrane protein (DUF2068 family)